MMLLLPGNAAAAMRVVSLPTHPSCYGWLLTPRRTMTKSGLHGMYYAVDNECFTLGEDFDDLRYEAALKRIVATHGRNACLFATAPDVVADASATWERSRTWLKTIRSIGLPAALVAQDGLENTAIQWSAFDALFIGGSTEWKMSSIAARLMLEARRRGKRTHVGRVNSWARVDSLREKPDSIDGTHWTKRPDKYLVQWHAELTARKNNLRFRFVEEAPLWHM